MKALVLVFALLAAPAALAQDRSAELDKAYAEVRAAHAALKQAEARRDAGAEPQSDERQGTAAGATRLNENYFARQALLEHELEQARRRYEAALKRWNDLK